METNPGLLRPVPTVCRLLCSNVRGLAGNLGDLTVASSQYDILLCSETCRSCWSETCRSCVTCQSYWFPYLVALSCCARELCLRPKGWRHTYEMDMEHFTNPSLSVVVAKCCFFGFVVCVTTDRNMCSVFTATMT